MCVYVYPINCACSVIYCFIKNNDELCLYNGFDEYKRYDSKLGDLIQTIICEVLNVDLIIMEGGTDVIHAKSVVERHNTVPIFLYRTGEHYDVIVPKSSQSCWHYGHEYDDNGVDDDDDDNDDDDDDDDDISKNASINDCEDEKLPVMSGCLDCSDEPKNFLYKLQQHRKNDPRNLITGSVNISSSRNKFGTVQHMLKCQYMDILALCEKLDDSFPIGQFDVPGYKCIRRDRSRNGGGLLYYIRSDIPHRHKDGL